MDPCFKSYLSYKIVQPETIHDQAKMNLAIGARDSPENISSPVQGSNSLTGSPASKLARPISMSPGWSSATWIID